MKVQSLLVTRVNFKRSKRPRFQLAPRVDDSFVTDCSLHPAPQAKTFDTSCPASRPLKIRPEKFVPCVQLARDGNLPTIWISRRGSNARNLFYLLSQLFLLLSVRCSKRFVRNSPNTSDFFALTLSKKFSTRNSTFRLLLYKLVGTFWKCLVFNFLEIPQNCLKCFESVFTRVSPISASFSLKIINDRLETSLVKLNISSFCCYSRVRWL